MRSLKETDKHEYMISRLGAVDDEIQASLGPVMAIGGGEEKERGADVLGHFVELAGGDSAVIALIPSASSEPVEMAHTYRKAFGDLGVSEIRVVHVSSREEADGDDAIESLRDATGIFMSGGDQERLARLICGSRVDECIKKRSREGAVVGGTSAGAAILATHMIANGESGATPRKNMYELSEGLGILRNIVVDTHFGERGRTGRLLAIHAALTHVIAIGLDEDTAAIIDDDMLMNVVGSGAVTVIDGTSVRSDFDEVDDDDPIMVNGIEVHTVTSRYMFDLRARKFVPPLRSCFGTGGS